ncbi:uroporphyrinogen decarboxylase family protein [Chloroflexota bacterium]
MNRHERIQAALRGEEVDRTPLSLWRHYFREDQTSSGLAEVTVALARQYDLDLVKLTPSGLYAVEDWAAGCIARPGTDHDAPYLHTPAISDPASWPHLQALDPEMGALGRELEAIRQVASGLGGETPFLMTLFSPLTLAYKLAGESVIEHLRRTPAELHVGLEVIAETTARFGQAALAAGADGIFFAAQLANRVWLTPNEYQEFGERYDRVVLEGMAGQSAITVLHLHGREILFDLANLYPVHAVSWHDRQTPPNLLGARRQTDRAFLTGLDRELLVRGPETAIRGHVDEILAQTRGRGLILAPCCVIPTTLPASHLQAVRDAIPVR